jgi:NAD+ diphosphatase
MLTRKFGKEVANYFSGSPLNRVSFLRTDHTFLTQSLTHATSSFLIFNDLQPLLQPSSHRLAYVSYDDVRPVIGGNPYAKAEEELIKEYNSSAFTPQLVFLGIDQSRDGVAYRDGKYKGAPYWALDVTPKGAVREAATRLIEEVESRGLQFAKERLPQMSLPAQEDTSELNQTLKPLCSPRRGRSSTGISEIPSALRAASRRSP